jgi:gamma-glutamyl phosphate reductase
LFGVQKVDAQLVDRRLRVRGFERIESLADSPQHIIAGHDPLTRALYASAGPAGLEIVSLTSPL